MASGPSTRPIPSSSESAGLFRGQMGNISRQALIFFAGTVFTTGLGYLFKVYLARALGAEALGIYALGMTLVGILGILNTLGLSQTAVRFVAAYSATGRFDLLRGFLGRGYLLLLTSNLFFAAVLLIAGPWAAVHFYHTPSLDAYLWFFAGIMLLGALNGFLSQTLTGYGDVARRTIINSFIGSPLTMAITVVLLMLGLGLRGYLTAQVAASLAVCALLAVSVWKLTPAPARVLSGRFAPFEREVFTFSAAAFGVSLLEFLLAQSDTIMIGFFRNARELGVYALATALVGVVAIILQSVNQIFSPTIAALHARGDHALLGRIFQTLTKWIIGLTLPLAAIMVLFAKPLMAIFGHDFSVGWPVVIIGTVGQLINCGVGSVGFLLLMTGQQGRLLRIQMATAVVMLGLNTLLIPRWGINGAALSSAASAALSNLLGLLQVRKGLGLFPYNAGYWRLLPPLAATCIVMLLSHVTFHAMKQDWRVIGASLALSYAAFIATALAWGLDDDDRLIAQAIWSRLCSPFQRAEVLPDA